MQCVPAKYTFKMRYFEVLYAIHYVMVGYCFDYEFRLLQNISPSIGIPYRGEFSPNIRPVPVFPLGFVAGFVLVTAFLLLLPSLLQVP